MILSEVVPRDATVTKIRKKITYIKHQDRKKPRWRTGTEKKANNTDGIFMKSPLIAQTLQTARHGTEIVEIIMRRAGFWRPFAHNDYYREAYCIFHLTERLITTFNKDPVVKSVFKLDKSWEA